MDGVKIAIVGRGSSGKSTMVKALAERFPGAAMLDAPYVGGRTYFVDGRDPIVQADVATVHPNVAGDLVRAWRIRGNRIILVYMAAPFDSRLHAFLASRQEGLPPGAADAAADGFLYAEREMDAAFVAFESALSREGNVGADEILVCANDFTGRRLEASADGIVGAAASLSGKSDPPREPARNGAGAKISLDHRDYNQSQWALLCGALGLDAGRAKRVAIPASAIRVSLEGN